MTSAAAVLTPVVTETFAIDPTHSDIEFRVRHLVSRVRGRFTRFSGSFEIHEANPAASSAVFTIDPSSIDTNSPDRDTHLRSGDFFDVEKFPEITFRSESITGAGDGRFDVTGALSLRGVEKKVTVPVTFLGFAADPWGNRKAGFEATVKISRKEFGMVWNAALETGGVLVGDEVELNFNLQLVRAS